MKSFVAVLCLSALALASAQTLRSTSKTDALALLETSRMRWADTPFNVQAETLGELLSGVEKKIEAERAKVNAMHDKQSKAFDALLERATAEFAGDLKNATMAHEAAVEHVRAAVRAVEKAQANTTATEEELEEAKVVFAKESREAKATRDSLESENQDSRGECADFLEQELRLVGAVRGMINRLGDKTAAVALHIDGTPKANKAKDGQEVSLLEVEQKVRALAKVHNVSAVPEDELPLPDSQKCVVDEVIVGLPWKKHPQKPDHCLAPAGQTCCDMQRDGCTVDFTGYTATAVREWMNSCHVPEMAPKQPFQAAKTKLHKLLDTIQARVMSELSKCHNSHDDTRDKIDSKHEQELEASQAKLDAVQRKADYWHSVLNVTRKHLEKGEKARDEKKVLMDRAQDAFDNAKKVAEEDIHDGVVKNEADRTKALTYLEQELKLISTIRSMFARLNFGRHKDCEVSEWGKWSECANCEKVSERLVLHKKKGNGTECPALRQTQKCPCMAKDLHTCTHSSNEGVTGDKSKFVTFTGDSCKNGLPAGECMPVTRAASQCGSKAKGGDGKFTAIGPNEDFGPGMNWWNENDCGAPDLKVDYLCQQPEGMLHRCSYTGASPQNEPEQKEIRFKAKDCTNGLPVGKSCFASIRKVVSHGASESSNWRVLRASSQKGAGVRWNEVGPSAPVELKVDFLCGNNEIAGRRLHHCVVNEQNVEGKNNKKYDFIAEDCTGGLPQGKCIASVLAGSEMNKGEKISTVERTDFTAYAPNDEYKGKTGAAWVRWFNANAKASLSRMSVAVDYLCED
jgi:hypothetical protein